MPRAAAPSPASGTEMRAVLTATSRSSSSSRWTSAAWVPESARRVPTAITTTASPMIPNTSGDSSRAVMTVKTKVTP